MPGEIGTAHNFPRDIFRGILEPMFGRVRTKQKCSFSI